MFSKLLQTKLLGCLFFRIKRGEWLRWVRGQQRGPWFHWPMNRRPFSRSQTCSGATTLSWILAIILHTEVPWLLGMRPPLQRSPFLVQKWDHAWPVLFRRCLVCCIFYRQKCSPCHQLGNWVVRIACEHYPPCNIMRIEFITFLVSFTTIFVCLKMTGTRDPWQSCVFALLFWTPVWPRDKKRGCNYKSRRNRGTWFPAAFLYLCMSDVGSRHLWSVACVRVVVISFFRVNLRRCRNGTDSVTGCTAR